MRLIKLRPKNHSTAVFVDAQVAHRLAGKGAGDLAGQRQARCIDPLGRRGERQIRIARPAGRRPPRRLRLAGIGQQPALGIIEARSLTGGYVERLKDAARDASFQHGPRLADGGRLVDRIGDELGLNRQALDPRVDQTLAHFIEDQGAGDNDRHAEQVEDNDRPSQARTCPPPFSRRPRLGGSGPRGSCATEIVIRIRGIDSRRHRGFRSRRSWDRPPGISCACA